MTGISEILVLILIIACILILPRMMQGEKTQSAGSAKVKSLTGKTRMGIVFSIIYPIVAALIMKPWNGNLILFVFLGIFPVILGWLIVWVLAGFRKK